MFKRFFISFIYNCYYLFATHGTRKIMISRNNRGFCLLVSLFVILPVLLLAQQNDPVLFEVEGNPVHVSEFDYIYNKNNSQNANYSRESLNEYLDLYTKFKLKVQRARDMKLDTIVSLQDELEGYQRQLANSYLMDKEVKDKLILEAYDRMQSDVEFSHIFIKVPPKADTTAFYKKATRVKDLLAKGQDFSNVAARMSEDKYSAKNDGYAGWINGMMPDGFYALESALYNGKPGDITGPVRSKNGYHILNILDTRPNPGEYEIAHIKINIEKGKEKENEKKIRDIYTQLEKVPFNQLARQYSADANSARSGGKIGYVGVKNPYDKHISNAIFELKKPGDYTEPLKTGKSWHIIKLLKIKPQATIEKMRPELESKVLKNERYNLVKSTMIQRLKAENHFEYDDALLTEFTESLDSDFFTFKWKPVLDKKKVPLMSLGKGKIVYSMNDFMAFVKKNSRDRSRMARSTTIPIAVQKLFTKFSEEKTLKYEQKNLENKYPEFRALMREYEEGILLFEATKINVWDKASSDSTGLANFFATNDGNYRWPDKADIKTYAIKTVDPKLIKKISKTAARKGEEVVKEKFGSPDLEMLISSKTIDRDEDTEKLYTWKKRSISEPQVDDKINTTIFTVVEKVTPARNKTLDEARGFVIADYQDYLEKEWVKVLRSKYHVKVYQDVFESMIK